MSFLRYIIGLFRTHGGPNQIAFSACLGVFIGLIPFTGIQIVLWAFLFLFFRFSLITILIFASIFRFIHNSGLDFICYKIGKYFLEDFPSLTLFWQKFCQLPVISLFQFHKYYVLGSWMVAITLSVVVYIIIRLIYAMLRKSKVVQSVKNSKFVEKLGLFFYGEKEFKGNRCLRGHLILYVFTLIFIASVIISSFGGILLKDSLEKFGKQYFGSVVTIEQASISIFKGRIFLKGVRLFDFNSPEKEVFLADFAEIKISSFAFYGRMFIEKLEVNGFTLNIWKNKSQEVNVFSFEKTSSDKELTPQKIESLDIDDKQKKILAGETSDFFSRMKKWLVRKKAIKAYEIDLRNKRIEQYAKKNKAPVEVVEVLINSVVDVNILEQLLQLSPKQILLMTGQAKYIAQVPIFTCSKLLIENGKINFVLSNNKNSITFRMVLCNISSNPKSYKDIEGNFSFDGVALNSITDIYKLPVTIEDGILKTTSNFSYNTSQDILKANNQHEVKDLSIDSENSTNIHRANIDFNALVRQLNEMRNFKIQSTIQGPLYDWQTTFTPSLQNIAKGRIVDETKKKIKEFIKKK